MRPKDVPGVPGVAAFVRIVCRRARVASAERRSKPSTSYDSYDSKPFNDSGAPDRTRVAGSRGARRAFRPGDAIAVDLDLGPLGVMPVTHVGIVSRVEPDGATWVISSSFRRGACHEETLEEFSCGGEPYHHDLPRRVDDAETLRRARSLLGAPWRLLSANCEHVASWCAGHEPHSPQLRVWGRRAAKALAWTVATIVAARGGAVRRA